MSQKRRAPGPPSSSTSDASKITPVLPATSLRPSSSQEPRPASFHETAHLAGPAPAGHMAMGSIGTLDQKSTPERPGPTAPRALGVQSILNPSQPDSYGSAYPPDEAGVGGFSSPRPSFYSGRKPTPPPRSSPHILTRSDRGSPGDHISSAPSTDVPRPARRVLTPKSPRAASFSSRRSITASSTFAGPAHPAPSHGRIYTAEPGQHPGAEIPPLPSSTGPGRQNYPYSPWNDPGPMQTGRRSVGPGPAPGAGSLPAVALPSDGTSTSHSSYSQYSQTSPHLRYDNSPASLNQYHHGLSRPPPSLAHDQGGGGMAEAPREMGPGSIQITLDTERGRITMPVEVDVQQASKVADEKRKRNAGASARFRERRKQKEKEAAATIAGLEKEIREIAEERDFYINERNVYRDFLIRNMGPSHLPLRPPSPPIRRLPPPPPAPPLHETTPQPWPEAVGEPAEPVIGNPKIRRTGGFPPAYTSPPSASPMVPPQVPSYGVSLAGHAPPFPPSFPDARSSGAPVPPPVAAPSRAASYDPFRRDPYDRSWNPGR